MADKTVKLVKMTAITRVGYDGKVAVPGEEFEIAESEADRLEKAGAAQKVKKGA